MTELDPPDERPAEPAPAVRTARWTLGPEGVATVIAVLIIAAITGAFVLGTTPVTTAGPGGSPPPGATSTPSASAGSAFSVADITNALELDRRLVAAREELRAELAASPVDASAIATTMRRANADLIAGVDVAARLAQRPETSDVGKDLGAIYADAHDRIDAALDNSVRNAKAYHDAAVDVVASLARLDPIDALLVAIRDGATGPTPSSPPSGPPATIRPSAPPPSATPSPTSPPASAGSSAPTPSGLAGSTIGNGGFEAGVGAPWELVVTPPASATLSVDGAVHASGAQAARVDIAVGGDERAAVAVRQGGQSIQAGARYVGTVALRAASTREVRLRIASAAGDTYGTRLFVVGPEWQTVTLDFTPFATDPNAYFEVDLGRSAASVWLDDASFAQVPATAG